MSETMAVPLHLLRRYLAFRGWHRQENATSDEGAFASHAFANAFFIERSTGPRNVDLYVLSEPEADDVEMVIPRDIQSADATRRLDGAIETLSQVEGRDPVQVIGEIRAIGFDIVTSRIPDELVVNDTINLEQAVNYTAGLKKLLAAGATTELAPDVYFHRVKKEATVYAEQCRFGHTFRGSFGFTVESPIDPNPAIALPGMEYAPIPPFERRVIERIARGVRTIQDAVRADDPDIVIGGYQRGFSANMCEEFAVLIEQTAPTGLVLGFSFSPEWPTREMGEFLVQPEHIEMSKTAAKRMREQPTSTVLEISGRITRLQNEADPTDLYDETHEREIIVHWKSDDGNLNVRLSLAPSQYLVAVDAHMRGRPVTASGRLEKHGRRWVLVNPTDFRG